MSARARACACARESRCNRDDRLPQAPPAFATLANAHPRARARTRASSTPATSAAAAAVAVSVMAVKRASKRANERRAECARSPLLATVASRRIASRRVATRQPPHVIATVALCASQRSRLTKTAAAVVATLVEVIRRRRSSAQEGKITFFFLPTQHFAAATAALCFVCFRSSHYEDYSPLLSLLLLFACVCGRVSRQSAARLSEHRANRDEKTKIGK